MNLTKPVLLDKAAGVLVASAAGDALGAGYEFAQLVSAQDVDMIGGGLGNFALGEWTDDTSMGVAVAEAAATGTALESDAGLDLVLKGFLAWFDAGPADIGIQTNWVLGQLRGRTPSEARRAAQDYLQMTGRGAGNGSLMRTAVIALTALGDDALIAKRARAVSELTHADPLASEACVIWSIAIDRAIRDNSLDGVYDGISALPPERQDFWREKVEEVKTRPMSDFTPNGFVVTALQAALSAVWSVPHTQPGDLEASLRNAVSIGDDTDTVAAIAGMLLGARWGMSAVPLWMRSKLHGWDAKRTHDLVRLALKAVNGGIDDPHGWPSSASMLPYYQNAWSEAPYVRTLRTFPGTFKVGNVFALTDAATDADVTVSLCRLGQDERRGATHAEVWLADSGDLAVNPNLDYVIADTARFITDKLNDGQSVFLHCVHGASRTPIIAAKVLSLLDGADTDASLTEVLDMIPRSNIKPGLTEALKRS